MKRKIIYVILFILAVIALVFTIYANDYYRAGSEALAAAEDATIDNGNLVFMEDVTATDTKNTTGFIIYPGGKVDERAYSVLAEKLNKNGYTVIIAKMPLHLSIIDSNKADEIITTHSEIDEWIIIGHSLGGTSASIYAEHSKKLKGIVFLGSYPYRDLSSLDIKTLTLTGSNDNVLNSEKAQDAVSYYPSHASFITINGGNHAGFGCYGEQKGDGIADISWEEQHDITVSSILEYFEE